jgi:hypothetical protein
LYNWVSFSYLNIMESFFDITIIFVIVCWRLWLRIMDWLIVGSMTFTLTCWRVRVRTIIYNKNLNKVLVEQILMILYYKNMQKLDFIIMAIVQIFCVVLWCVDTSGRELNALSQDSDLMPKSSYTHHNWNTVHSPNNQNEKIQLLQVFFDILHIPEGSLEMCPTLILAWRNLGNVVRSSDLVCWSGGAYTWVTID